MPEACRAGKKWPSGYERALKQWLRGMVCQVHGARIW